MNTKQFLQEALNDNSVEAMLDKYLSRSGTPSRGGGGASASINPNLVGGASTKDGSGQLDPKYQADVDNAIATAKDDTATADIVQQYLAYEQDPKYQQLEQEAASTRASMSSSGGAGWNWATKGRYYDSLSQRLGMLDSAKREIQQKYVDRMNLGLAQQEKFDYGKAATDYNYETKHWEKKVTGSKGTVRNIGEAQGPMEERTDQFGQRVIHEKRPGTTNMTVDPTKRYDPGVSDYASPDAPSVDAFRSDTPPETGPFAGGVAKAERPMQILNMSPDEQVKVAHEKAAANQANAAADKLRVFEGTPSGTRGRIGEGGVVTDIHQNAANPNWAPPGSGQSSGSRVDALVASTFGRLLAQAGAYGEVDEEGRAALWQEANKMVRGSAGNNSGGAVTDFTKFDYDRYVGNGSGDQRPVERLSPGTGRSVAPQAASGPSEGEITVEKGVAYKIVNGQKVPYRR